MPFKCNLHRYSVADWLERWGRCELSEDTLDGDGNVYNPRKRGNVAHVSEQILRGYLFYPLEGDERGLVGWENVPARWGLYELKCSLPMLLERRLVSTLAT